MVCFLTVLEIVAEELLFKWAHNRSKLLREFWEDYALVMETLEENQVKKSHMTVGRPEVGIMIQLCNVTPPRRFTWSGQFSTE